MKIRAITIGQNAPFFNENEEFEIFIATKYQEFSDFCNALIIDFEKNNIEVETKRVCTQPIFSESDTSKNKYILNEKLPLLNSQISILEKICKKNSIDYFSSCTMMADKFDNIEIFDDWLSNDMPNLLLKRDNFFTSLPVASTFNGINLSAVKIGAKIIKELSKEDPFNNLKFCVSSNVKPDTPFFPAAYHLSENPSFSLALEMADEVVQVFEKSNTLNDAKRNLKAKFNEIYEILRNISEKRAKTSGLKFSGIDFSPAPYPTYDKSIGTAVEKLGFEYFGAYGSLIAIGLIKNSIPKEKEKIIGFSGFMQPVLEDFTISKSLSENKFNLDTLLLYSTICGTGLDCVPLPGDITERELFYILLDLCTISITHDKPLTARLMPMPGKKAGDDVEFDFEYFAKSKVMEIRRLTEAKKNDIFHRNEKSYDLL